MLKILIVDTETTGLDADAEVCEFAVTLYQIDGHNSGVIASASTLLAIKGENKAQAINRISPELAQDSESVSPIMLDAIRFLAGQAECAVAFPASFDRPHWEKLITTPWVCAQTDFRWCYPGDRFSLTALALWLGIGVSSVHRAGDDVRLLVECFNRIDDLEDRFVQAIMYSRSPWVEVQALVSYDDRELAKALKFAWIDKKWVKKIKSCDLDVFVEHLGFEFVVSDIEEPKP